MCLISELKLNLNLIEMLWINVKKYIKSMIWKNQKSEKFICSNSKIFILKIIINIIKIINIMQIIQINAIKMCCSIFKNYIKIVYFIFR